MGGFDRSQFRAATADAVKQQKEELEAKRPTGGGDRSYLKIDVGDNKFRIMPYHPDGGGISPMEAKCVVFLDCNVPKRDDDGKEVKGQMEIKRKPVFNAVVHGNLPYDLVDEYISFAKKTALPNMGDADVQKRIWTRIIGDSKAAQKSNETNLKASTTWMAYASKWSGTSWGPIGLLELKSSVKDGMTERAAEYESPDPFSDPDEGIAVIITKAKEAIKPADWYKVKMDKVRNGRVEEYVATPLTDEQLEALSKLKPLKELYSNVFTRSDLALQIDGLKRFDDKLLADFGFSVFAYDEFLDKVERLYELTPEKLETTSETQEEENYVEAQEEEQQAPAPPVRPTAAKPTPTRPIVQTTPPLGNRPTPIRTSPANTANVTHEEEVVSSAGSDTKARLEDMKRKMGKDRFGCKTL